MQLVRVPRPQLAVRLMVPDDTCRARVRARGIWAHARGLHEAGLDRYVTSARRVSDIAAGRASELAWPVVTLDNHEQSAAEVARAVAAVLDGAGTTPVARPRQRTYVPRLPRPSRVRALATGRFGPAVLPPDRVHEVLDAYGLAAGAGPQSDLRIGRRSLNAAVATPRGMKVVKRYRPQWGEPLVEYGHSVLRRLEERSFPSVRLTRTPEGRTHTVVGGSVYAVFDFVEGTSYSLNFLRRATVSLCPGRQPLHAAPRRCAGRGRRPLRPRGSSCPR